MALLSIAAKQLDDLLRMGYPEEVAQRIVSGDLPMDTASRMERAEAMGFDPTNVQYHGTEADFTEFFPSMRGKMGPGVYASPDPNVADKYTYKAGSNIIPIVTRGKYLSRSKAVDDYRDLYGPNANNELSKIVADEGYSGMAGGLLGTPVITETVTFDPRDIRSYLSAAFDPEYKGPNILGQYALPAVGAGLLAAAPEDAEAGFVNRGGRTLLEAFHGSPHKFDRFSTDAIGTGEGAQAYGHGLYFADSKDLATAYRDTLKYQHDPREGINKLVQDLSEVADGKMLVRNNVTGTIVPADPSNPIHKKILSGEIGAGTYEVVPDGVGLRDSIVEGMKRDPRLADYATDDEIVSEIANIVRGQEADGTVTDSAMTSYRRLSDRFGEPEGALYRVDIDVTPDQLLDWDKSLSEQSEGVKNILRDNEGLLRERLYTIGDNFEESYVDGSALYNAVKRELRGGNPASFLSDLGIHGIKYLDRQSRNKPLRDIKNEFLAQLPEDAEVSDVIEMLDDGAFTDANASFLNALAEDDWLGFDYPAQAISAALSDNITNYDPSKGLKDSVARLRDNPDNTSNYVIFDDSKINIADRYAINPMFAPSQDRALDYANRGLIDAATVDEQRIAQHQRDVNQQMARLGLLADPMYDYGDIIPAKTNIATGETSLAFPGIVRDVVGGLLDLANMRRSGVYNPQAVMDVAL